MKRSSAKERSKKHAKQRAKNERWLRSEYARLEAENERLRDLQRRGKL